MKKIKFSSAGKCSFLISLLLGTLLLVTYFFTKSWVLAYIGFYYIIIATIVNIIVLFQELLTFITNAADKKAHGNSVLLILLNIPITLLYLWIFDHI